MIFNVIITLFFLILLFPPPTISVNNVNDWNTEKNIHEEEIRDASAESASESKIEDPLFLEKFLDLDQDGKIEKITVFSTLGKEIGDENTKIYIDNNERPALDLGGYFDGIQVYKIDPQGRQVLEVRTAGGHSIETTFYTYKKGSLKIVPVSTAKPPSFYGIVSRNVPELKDSDGDGALELFAYYRHFPPDFKRTVEVYQLSGEVFQKIEEYEEPTPEIYL
ncbi:MAG: hypothetical protein AAB856_00425 [Patescibacteria group bacterium]